MQVVAAESPAKSKTANRYLGDSYCLLSTLGHASDPAAEAGLAGEDFAMTYATGRWARRFPRRIAAPLLATNPRRGREAMCRLGDTEFHDEGRRRTCLPSRCPR